MDGRPIIAKKIKYKIADLKVLLTTYHPTTEQRAKEYISEENWDDKDADVVIDVGQEYYEKRYKDCKYPTNYNTIEYGVTGSLFNRYLLKYDGCMLHSSAVVVDGYAYLFSADSGTGKSTHTGLWLEHFKDKAFIINDDKPAIRKIDNQWYVYGTPWSGKTDQNVNVKAKLGGIVFIERSENNWIRDLEAAEAIPLFFNQTIRRMKTEQNMDLVLTMMERVLTENPLYKMGCNISDEAVETAYQKIRRV